MIHKKINYIHCNSIKSWHEWLEINHESKNEIWLIMKTNEERFIDYIDAVEEALCFGWIDGLYKYVSGIGYIQRFTPRKQKSHWTELNKERVRRLIKLGRMKPSGQKKTPDLSTNTFNINQDIMNVLNSDAELLNNFNHLPELYVRVRISYIQEYKLGSLEYNKRLSHFLKMTRKNQMFGNWNDQGRLINY